MSEVYKLPKLDDALKENDEIKIQIHDSIESVEAILWGIPPEEMDGGTIGYALMHKTQVTCSGSRPRVPMIMHRFPVFPHTAPLSTFVMASNKGG